MTRRGGRKSARVTTPTKKEKKDTKKDEKEEEEKDLGEDDEEEEEEKETEEEILIGVGKDSEAAVVGGVIEGRHEESKGIVTDEKEALCEGVEEEVVEHKTVTNVAMKLPKLSEQKLKMDRELELFAVQPLMDLTGKVCRSHVFFFNQTDFLLDCPTSNCGLVVLLLPFPSGPICLTPTHLLWR